MKRSKLLLFAGIFTLTATAGVQSSYAEGGEEAKKYVEVLSTTSFSEDPFIGPVPTVELALSNRCEKRVILQVCVKREVIPIYREPYPPYRQTGKLKDSFHCGLGMYGEKATDYEPGIQSLFTDMMDGGPGYGGGSERYQRAYEGIPDPENSYFDSLWFLGPYFDLGG